MNARKLVWSGLRSTYNTFCFEYHTLVRLPKKWNIFTEEQWKQEEPETMSFKKPKDVYIGGKKQGKQQLP